MTHNAAHANLQEQAMASFQHSSAVVALSWTTAGDGLLVAGELGDVSMYEIAVRQEDSSQNRYFARYNMNDIESRNCSPKSS